MGQQIESLARFVAETRWQDIPADVQDQAKVVLLDTLGVILAGSEEPEVVNLRARLADGSRGGTTIYARGFPTADPRTAALLNATAGRMLELCETHRFAFCQAAVQALPTILAVGETVGSSGGEALAALVLGYEVTARIAGAATRRRLAHHNGQASLLGAVAAGARLRGFDAAQVSRALRIGANLVLTPSYTNTVAGGTALNVAGGMSGLAGALVPELALAGFEAREDAIELAFSELVGDGFRPEVVTEALGERWEITRNRMRLRACCTPIYAALDALEEILAEVRPSPDEIERIDVATFDFAATMRETEPANAFAARYSLPHAAASFIVLGGTGQASFSADQVHNPAIAALRRRVHVVEDPALTSAAAMMSADPRRRPGRVTLTLEDGRSITRMREIPRGDVEQPPTREELRTKFRELSAPLITPEGIVATMSLVDRFERVAHLGELPSLMRQQSRSEAV